MGRCCSYFSFKIVSRSSALACSDLCRNTTDPSNVLHAHMHIRIFFQYFLLVVARMALFQKKTRCKEPIWRPHKQATKICKRISADRFRPVRLSARLFDTKQPGTTVSTPTTLGSASSITLGLHSMLRDLVASSSIRQAGVSDCRMLRMGWQYQSIVTVRVNS